MLLQSPVELHIQRNRTVLPSVSHANQTICLPPIRSVTCVAAEARDNDGRAALLEAIGNGNPEVVVQLLSAGARVGEAEMAEARRLAGEHNSGLFPWRVVSCMKGIRKVFTYTYMFRALLWARSLGYAVRCIR